MLSEYVPVLVLIAVSIIIASLMIFLGSLLGRNKPNNEKISAYECGFKAFDDARSKFDVRFYLVAILFILFDLEIAFLYPWAIVLKKVGWPALIAVLIFLGILAIGFIYEWRKGALEWE
jgi:NADH-quinone oxidoreductase subunit A